MAGKALWFTKDNLKRLAGIHKTFANDTSITFTAVNKTFDEVYNNLGEIDRRVTELEKSVYTTFTIPISGWSSDSTSGYPNYYDFSVSGLTTADHVNVVLDAAGVHTSIVCGMCPTTEALEGKFRIRSYILPSVAITAQYQVIKGK